MKTFLVVCLLAAAVASVLAGDGDIMDTFDSEAIVTNEPKFRALHACVMDLAPCDPENQRLKDGGQKLVPTQCGDCTPGQKEKFEKMLKLAQEKFPKEIGEIIQKFGGKKPE